VIWEYKGGVSFVLAVAAAFVNALTSVLQRIGVEDAPSSTTLRLSLMSYAIRRVIWLVGFALMLVEFALQATALRFGELSVVQPILTTELLFLMLILGVYFRYHIGLHEWLGALIVVVGLGMFFVAADPHGGDRIPTDHQWVVASVILIAAITGCILAALRGPRWWRAAAFGAATAVTAAYSAALTKSVTTLISQGWGHVLTHAQPYLLAITGIGTVFLIQNALHAGPITASRTTMVTLNPLVSIVLGLTLFGDILRRGPFWVVAECVALAVLVGGIVVLARSPLVAGAGAPDQPGELLGNARQRNRDRNAAPGIAVPTPVGAGPRSAVADPPVTAGEAPPTP
jgi:drug/metabolite transporter (DMT)-like permease